MTEGNHEQMSYYYNLSIVEFLNYMALHKDVEKERTAILNESRLS